MKNPLKRRLPRELREDFGKYLVIFLFMAATIGFVSGFLVADSSMLSAYEESFDTYHIEDGNFELAEKGTEELLEEVSQEEVKIYENFYVEEDTDVDLDGETDSTLRIFTERSQVNLVCLMEGAFPKEKNEIAIDRMYAVNNGIKVGDTIETGGKNLKISGLVALSDYSALFSDNGDMMFDSIKFGVAVMTKEGFEGFGENHLHYSYSFRYVEEPEDEEQEKEKSDEFLEKLGSSGLVTNYIPRYTNQAIQFTGEDMGSDKSMIVVLLYILIVIMAFVFAVTTSNTIVRESAVIGTLRASGYTRGELLGHYMELPLIVTLIAAVIGNILGYTLFKDVCAGMYYGSYSLPTYETRWNVEAFLLTTVVPLLIMLAVNLLLISRKLRLSPLDFLRRDLSGKKHKRAVRLPKFKFFTRFRLRIILQNRTGYLTLFIGILFANILLLFGMMMPPLLTHFQEETVEHMIADYQYILKVPAETKTEDAEKYAVTTLKQEPENRDSEEITVYGVAYDSKYITEELPETGVLISEGYSEKYGVHKGDTILLKESYGSKEYELKVEGFYEYPAALAVFMPLEEYREVFGTEEEYYNGYFSNKEITDIEENYVASCITVDDLTKLSRQLDVSMGSMMSMVNVFAVILFALLIYLLTKLIIEKNANSISMVKILGYENREISSLYLTATTWVVSVSFLLSLVFATWVMKVIYQYIMMEFNGWLTFYVKPSIYPEMFCMGMAAYAVVALLQFWRIKRVPMEEALKNVE